MLIDTHCHLDFGDFDSDRDEVIKRAYEGGVKKIINIGCNLERARKSIEIAKKYDFISTSEKQNEDKFSFSSSEVETQGLRPSIFASAGLHPQEADKGDEKFFEELRELLKEPKVVAIGECGMEIGKDRPSGSQGRSLPSIQKQKEVFLKHLVLAREFKKPVIIHCRNAYQEILEILREEKRESPKLRGVAHFFSGRLSQAKELFELGFLISFTGVITFARDYDKMIKASPLEKIMIETDAPFVAPRPWRGKRNEPLYVKQVAEKIAELKGISFEEVARITTKNAEKLFGI